MASGIWVVWLHNESPGGGLSVYLGNRSYTVRPSDGDHASHTRCLAIATTRNNHEPPSGFCLSTLLTMRRIS